MSDTRRDGRRKTRPRRRAARSKTATHSATRWGVPAQPVKWPHTFRHIEQRLQTISQSGTPPTLEQVEYLLKHGAAWVLSHPLVWSVVREYWSPYHLDEEGQAGRLRLAAALVEGLSEGTHAVAAVKPRPAAPGRAPTLFPKLGETHGWWNSEEGDADFSDASRFRRLYDTLMAALRSAVLALCGRALPSIRRSPATPQGPRDACNGRRASPRPRV